MESMAFQVQKVIMESRVKMEFQESLGLKEIEDFLVQQALQVYLECMEEKAKLGLWDWQEDLELQDLEVSGLLTKKYQLHQNNLYSTFLKNLQFLI